MPSRRLVACGLDKKRQAEACRFFAKERLKVVSIEKETQKAHQQIVKNQLNSAFRKGRSSSSPQDEEMAL